MSHKDEASIQKVIRSTALILVLFLSTLMASVAFAHETPSSELLLPYFEVDLTGGSRTTLFSVVNSSPDPVQIRMSVFTNWGVEVFNTRTVIKGDAVRTIDLRDWLIEGQLFGRAMDTAELAHCQAAISGQVSPRDNLFYGTAIAPELAVGFVKIRAIGQPRPEVLFGDYFIVDPSQDLAQGDVLIDIDKIAGCADVCQRHGLRFLDTHGFEEGTELLIWTDRTNEPADDPVFPSAEMTLADLLSYRQNGEVISRIEMDFLPLQIVKVSDLGLPARSGWFDLLTSEDTFIAVRHASTDRFSVGLMTTCLPIHGGGSGSNGDLPAIPSIRIEKSTNGHDADQAPGPRIFIDAPVTWEYRVTNTGQMDLHDVVVSDDRGVEVTCPRDHLRVGLSMTCTGHGTARGGPYENIGTVTARDDEDREIRDDDPSHYIGVIDPNLLPSIQIEKATNGDDADAAPGPKVTEGDPVDWTYEVTNNGGTPLANIVVSDDQGVAVSCPQTELGIGESMTCTGHGTAILGQYANVGSVVGTAPEGAEVTDDDPSHYYGEIRGIPSIDIEKATNGHDADLPPGVQLTEGDDVLWTYVVRNSGNVRLDDIVVIDDQEVTVSCPRTSLEPDEEMTCTADGTAILGPYKNMGTAIGTPPEGDDVTDSDPSHYYGREREEPGIRIEKATNGEDADTAPGPTLYEGQEVDWTYVVTNTGNVALFDVTVTDDQGVSVVCPKSSLIPSESMVCGGWGMAVLGQYRNVGLTTGTSPEGTVVDDSDPSHYYGMDSEDPSIDIEKATNDEDADEAPGPHIFEGAAVTWTYVVTNTGNIALADIMVTDDQGVSVSCPQTALAVGESMTCTGHGTAIFGQYRNVGTADGTSPKGTTVSDSDPSHYKGKKPQGTEGCTPGYWKNHTDSWAAAGLSPSATVGSVFSDANLYPAIAAASLLDALNFNGGPEVEDAARILLRAAVAGLLNASHPDVEYPWTANRVISSTNGVLASGNRGRILGMAETIDDLNNLGCPLN